MEYRYEGDLNGHGFLGILEGVKVGYENIRVFFKIDADISDEQKEELVQLAKKYSPVYKSVANPVPITVEPDSK